MSYANQRDFERVTINTPLTLYLNDGVTHIDGLCKDISESGVGIQMHRPLSLGTECNIKIHDGKPNNTKYQALIEIVRVNVTEEYGEEIFHVGARILHRY